MGKRQKLHVPKKLWLEPEDIYTYNHRVGTQITRRTKWMRRLRFWAQAPFILAIAPAIVIVIIIEKSLEKMERNAYKDQVHFPELWRCNEEEREKYLQNLEGDL